MNVCMSKAFEGVDDYQKGAYYQITTAYAYAINSSVDLGLESVFCLKKKQK